jgi:hypothetical protein
VDEIACFFFVGVDPENGISKSKVLSNDIVELAISDTYDDLPQKVLGFFRWALENSDFEWLFKCDDDTYLDLERLGELPITNVDLIGDESLEQRGAPSGGAGYLLSRRAVEALCKDEQLALTGPEDLIIGHAIAGYGMPTHSTQRLCLHSQRHPRRDNNMISAHWCDPDRMRMIFAIRYDETIRQIEATHPFWQDSLFLFPDGTFVRKSSSCSGRWQESSNGHIHLDWSGWNPEELIPADPSPSPHDQRNYRCVPAPTK